MARGGIGVDLVGGHVASSDAGVDLAEGGGGHSASPEAGCKEDSGGHSAGVEAGREEDGGLVAGNGEEGQSAAWKVATDAKPNVDKAVAIA